MPAPENIGITPPLEERDRLRGSRDEQSSVPRSICGSCGHQGLLHANELTECLAQVDVAMGEGSPKSACRLGFLPPRYKGGIALEYPLINQLVD